MAVEQNKEKSKTNNTASEMHYDLLHYDQGQNQTVWYNDIDISMNCKEKQNSDYHESMKLQKNNTYTCVCLCIYGMCIYACIYICMYVYRYIYILPIFKKLIGQGKKGLAF